MSQHHEGDLNSENNSGDAKKNYWRGPADLDPNKPADATGEFVSSPSEMTEMATVRSESIGIAIRLGAQKRRHVLPLQKSDKASIPNAISRTRTGHSAEYLAATLETTKQISAARPRGPARPANEKENDRRSLAT